MKLIKQKRFGKLVGLGISLMCIMLTGVHAQHLTALDIVTPSDVETELHYRFDKNVQAPKSFYLKDKGLLVVDFTSTGVNQTLDNKIIDNDLISDVQNLYANNKVRSRIKIKPNISYTMLHKGNEVVVTFSRIDPFLSDDIIIADNGDKPSLETKAKDIEFYRNSQGAGVIDVFLPDDKTHVQVIDNQEKGVVLSVPSLSWNANQVRRIEVIDFATPVSALEVVNNSGTAEVRVRTQANYEYSSQQIGNKYQLIIKPKIKPLDIKSRPLCSLPAEYTDDLISLNLKDVDVRVVLNIIANIKGLNIVVSDSINSRITIRLQNVPWNQALDVVLRSKGLVQQRSGTTIYIDPRGTGCGDHRELITEVFELKHAKASEIATVLRTSNKSSSESRHQSKGLSQYGELTIDPNQNLLIVRDTVEQMEIIKVLISQLVDKPLRQVVIQAQIIITNDSFIRELGIKWGASPLSDVELEQSRMSGFSPDQWRQKFLQRDPPIWDCGSCFEDGFGKVGLINILRKSFNVSSALSEMQANGQGEIQSSPTLVTTNRQEVYINHGVEIPFTSKDNDGNVTVEFKEVVMELKVTPNITPDDNIIMDIQIKNNDAGTQISGGDDATVNVTTDKREIKTQAIVRDGETIVFTIEKGDFVINKIPLLGDIPFIGNAVKSTKVVIFLTPNIVR